MKSMDPVEKGKRAEDIALNYLLNIGFELLDKNWRSGHREIDLIMECRFMIHFIEVRSRESDRVLDPLSSVVKRKQKLLIRAAKDYLVRNKICREVSFDVVSIIYKPFKIEYVEGAFFPI